MSLYMRCNSILLLTTAWLLSFEATAAPIDLNDFFGDPEVKIAPDGGSAEFKESEFSTVVLLTNDPFLGDPFVIVPGPSTFLTFNFEFIEEPGDNDQFSAYLFDAALGPIDGVMDEFFVNSTSDGMVSFDLSGYAGTEMQLLGLQFELVDLSNGSINSTATISNLALTQLVPVPAAVWLFGSGLIGLIGWARRKKV
jgi:hypothetical protein